MTCTNPVTGTDPFFFSEGLENFLSYLQRSYPPLATSTSVNNCYLLITNLRNIGEKALSGKKRLRIQKNPGSCGRVSEAKHG